MSSPPSPRTLEGLIEEEWGSRALQPDVLALLEPYRESVQYALDEFDDENQSWRDYCACIWGWGTGSEFDEGRIPNAVQDAIKELLKTPYVGPPPEPFRPYYVLNPIASVGRTIFLCDDPAPDESITIVCNPGRERTVTIADVKLCEGQQVTFTATKIEGPLEEGVVDCPYAWVPGHVESFVRVLDVIQPGQRDDRLLMLDGAALENKGLTRGQTLHYKTLMWLVTGVDPAGTSAPTGAVFVKSYGHDFYPSVGDTLAVRTPDSPGDLLDQFEFDCNARIWRRETAVLSSLTLIVTHPAYLRIIAMGQRAVRPILRDLVREPEHWNHALRAITGANPVLAADAGYMVRIAAAWLAWAKENGYEW